MFKAGKARSGDLSKRLRVTAAAVAGVALLAELVGVFPLTASAKIMYAETMNSPLFSFGGMWGDALCENDPAAGEGSFVGGARCAEEDEDAEKGSDAEGGSSAGSSVNLCAEVPEMIQYPDMQAGCEVYSLTAVLRSLGLDADPHTIADEYLPYDVIDGFAASAYRGSPYSAGEGLPPAIVRAGNAFLEDVGSDALLVDATGGGFEELERIANEGTPVLIWTTMYLQDQGLESPLPAYSFYPLEHCLVLLGGEGETVTTMDPMVGFADYDRSHFQRIFEQCGSMVVTLTT